MRQLGIAAAITAAALAAITVSATPARAAASQQPSDYATFTQQAQSQPGLFTIWRKDGRVYLELKPDQFDHDYIESIVPGNGAGGWFIVWGNTDHLPAMLVRFQRIGDKVAIVWPNTSFVGTPGTPPARAIERNFPQSVEGIGSIVATDPVSGDVIFDASPLLDDELDLADIINPSLNLTHGDQYKLDDSRTFFGPTKAFPKNVLIEADQTWATSTPHVIDTAPDARSVQMRIEYNFAESLGDADYVPRYADDRLGIYDDIYLQFDHDHQVERKLRYLIRWNMQPSDPSKSISPAKHPMIIYISNTVPEQYRPAIRGAVLEWNAAFERIGISNAVQVRDQPDDPSWDPDDIRYSVIRWVTEWQPSFGADSQTLYDPRTGQEFRTGILLSADAAGLNNWRYFIQPNDNGTQEDSTVSSAEDAFVAQDRMFGALALDLMNPQWGDRLPDWYVDDAMRSTVLHEMGHNMGLQHNFIGSEAYSAKDLQSKAFTTKYGTVSSVMEYDPINIWPKGTSQGTYFMDTLGPYDYYAIKWGYARIPGASTPDQEWPTLERWAQAWSDPRYRYGSDEDVSWGDGHAVDPRVQTGDLTNDNLAWAAVQFDLTRGLMRTLDSREPRVGEPYEFERKAFSVLFNKEQSLARIGENYIGGQYLSRAHRGDAGAQPPIVPVPRAEQERALALLDKYVFASSAWNVSPTLLSHLGYSEWSGYGYVSWTGYGNLPFWAYNPPAQHDYSIVDAIGEFQQQALNAMFKPAVLDRLVRNPLESPGGPTLTVDDLFDHMQATIFGDLNAKNVRDIPVLQRELQARYARLLISIATAPTPGTPFAAQAAARAKLDSLASSVSTSLRSTSLDGDARAHLELLRSLVATALKT